ncbi:DUF1273 domain-containing protein [Terrilactibacillus sp. S3-3]|nr:DUF1273 domain-containing protein [Terrilactibacillus sp. S3-3]
MGEGKAVLVTGYKPYELGIYSDEHPGVPVIKYCLRSSILQLIDDGASWFVISGQIGVELWAAEVVLSLKQEAYDVHLAVIVPFLEQEAKWKDEQKEKYYAILEQADFVDAISKRTYDSPTQLRQKNDFLVAKTDEMLLVLYDDSKPGSPEYYLVPARRKARHQSYPVFTIDRYDLELASQDLKEQDPNYWS